MISRLVVKNLTAFKELEIDFSPNINIIIGENSTGKTHVLKSIYAILKIMSEIQSSNNNEDAPEVPEQVIIYNELLDVIDPKMNFSDLFHNSTVPELELTIGLENNDQFSVMLSENFKASRNIEYCNTRYPTPTFIPSKEMMFFLPDLLSMVNKFEVRVDQSYSKIISAMARPKLKLDYLEPVAQSVLNKIEELIGGKFIVGDDLSMQFLENGHKRPANVIAEGYRKFGVLSRLIESGVIIPNKTGLLLWDEPEINLNPKLTKSLIEILMELSRAGQQIILVTHNFMLMKWFELYSERENENFVSYHSLYRDVDTNEISVSSTNQYDEIVSNTMEDAFASLVDFDIETAMEKLSAKVN